MYIGSAKGDVKWIIPHDALVRPSSTLCDLRHAMLNALWIMEGSQCWLDGCSILVAANSHALSVCVCVRVCVCACVCVC